MQQYGICPQSVIALRAMPNDNSEMVSQLLYGGHFEILESRKRWSRIRLAHDMCEGWVWNNQILQIPEDEFNKRNNFDDLKYSSDVISHVYAEDGILLPILPGSVITRTASFEPLFEGSFLQGAHRKADLVTTALLYLKAPYLKGGRTPFGIDSPGFIQMVYRINGHRLKRNTEDQSKQGEPLSFIEESEPGDLAFFDNSDGIIDHVGLILKDNHIIHAYGEVRIDKLDHTGVFDTRNKLYSHQLRVIKKIV